MKNQWQWLVEDFIPFFSLNEATAQKILNENKKKILLNRHC